MRRFVPPRGIEETIALCVRRLFGKNRFAKHLQTYLTRHYFNDTFFERELLWLVHADKLKIMPDLKITAHVPKAPPFDSICSLVRIRLRRGKNEAGYVQWNRSIAFCGQPILLNTWNKKTNMWTFNCTAETKRVDGIAWSYFAVKYICYKGRRRFVGLRGPMTKQDEVLKWAVDNKIIDAFTEKELCVLIIQ